MSSSKTEELLTVREAAQLLKISPVTITRWLKQGRLRGYHAGPRAIRIKQTDVEALLTPTPSVRTSDAPARPPKQDQPAQPTMEELARRRRLVATILARREARVITPLTTDELVHLARAEREYGDVE
ncbi:MAG TPA: helix-turn-helix domain-containing protein [Ktedonobacterales bacterium]|nr:helix-turn-helix domain-containing protein [Ktedonobacterales bacterium]